jgi:hypothetical protein
MQAWDWQKTILQGLGLWMADPTRNPHIKGSLKVFLLTRAMGSLDYSLLFSDLSGGRMIFFSRFKLFFWGLLFYGAVGFYSPALAVTTETQAKLVAENFIYFLGSSKTILFSSPLETNILDSSKPAVIAGWRMDLKDGGYILISASQVFSPVKAYSLKNDYTSLPIQYRQFLESELERSARIEAIQDSDKRISQGVSPKSSAEKAWEFLINMDTANRTVASYTPDTQLLTTTWHQGYPLNKFLPQIDGRHVPAGCVNTALAQVMRYHGYPESGRGATGYSWNDEPLETILYHPYYWENMLDSPGMDSPGHLQDEVAILIRDLAIVNQTTFGPDGSSAYLHQDDFVRFFGYSDTIDTMDNSDVGVFFSTIKEQIDQELPVLLSFPNHMVVADGYTADSAGRNVHINMGWAGAYDAYYFLEEAVETEDFKFEPNLDIIYNIKPCSGPDCVDPEPAANDILPRFNTEFKTMILNTDETMLTRIDVRDENDDPITFSTRLSNSQTISAQIANDILTITPLASSLNKAATLRVLAEAGGKIVQKDFLVMVANQNVTLGTNQNITGLFENQNSIPTHQAILEGECTIQGDRGYSNQAFFVNVRDSQGTILIPDADGSEDYPYPEIPPVFPLGLYTISASICSGSTCYSYTPGHHDAYAIQITQPGATATIEQIASLMGVDLTKIDFPQTGDLNHDGQVTLEDKILALKIVTRQQDIPSFDTSNDVSSDGRIGIEEALFWK